MKTHQIDLYEMLDYRDEKANQEIVYARADNKKLTFTIFGGYRVYVGGALLYEGLQPASAVEKYNSF